MAVGSEPVVVGGRGIEAVDLGAKCAIVLAASEALYHCRVEAPEHIEIQSGWRCVLAPRLDSGTAPRSPRVRWRTSHRGLPPRCLSHPRRPARFLPPSARRVMEGIRS